MEQKNVRFKKLDPRAQIPTYGSAFAAGADVRAVCDAPISIAPGETTLIHTGIAVEIPEGLVGLLYARSGLASKKGLAPANCVGVIDSDYRGELMVALYNHSCVTQVVEHGERIAQFVLAPYVFASFEETEELSETGRGTGGFGSTGTK